MVDAAIGEALAEAARHLGRDESVAEKLATIVTTLSSTLPGFDEAGISTVDRHGRVETKAATSQLVWDLDTLQYELGEGPCVDSLHAESIVKAPHVRHDQRWPRYVPRAVELGLRSQLAVRLYVDEERTIGGLNFYSTTSDEIDPDAVWIADVYAAQAAVVLGQARSLDELGRALESRQLIGQAVGLLMATYDLDEQGAFNFLARTSSHANVKLREIARRLVADHAAGHGVTVRQPPA